MNRKKPNELRLFLTKIVFEHRLLKWRLFVRKLRLLNAIPSTFYEDYSAVDFKLSKNPNL